MTKEHSPLIKSFQYLTIINLIITKLLFLYLQPFNWLSLLVFPSIFIYDIPYMIILYLLLQKSAWYAILVIWQIVIYSISTLFMLESGQFFSWNLIDDILHHFTSMMMISIDKWPIFVMILMSNLIIFTLIYLYVSKYSQYTKLHDGYNDMDTKSNPILNLKVFALAYVFLCVLPFIWHSKSHSDIIYRNEVMTADYYFIKTLFASHYGHAHNLPNFTLKNATHSNPMNMTRSDKSIFKNVLFLYMESARSDMIPFNPNSEFAKKYIPNTHLTPFLSNLFNSDSSVRVDHMKSVSSYTIKSLMSTQCGIFPLPVDMNVEFKNTPYSKCFPQILTESNFTTTHIQASDDHFDSQYLTIPQQGYSDKIGLIDMYDYFVDNGLKVPLKVGYFGYDDHYNLQFFNQTIQNSMKSGKPWMISSITNIMHNPFKTPNNFKDKHYDNDPLNNAELNAIRFTDEYIQQVFKLIENDENTLVVLLGDHGIAMGEHGKYGMGEIEYKEVFDVPCLFYSAHPIWKSQIAPRLRTKLKFNSNPVMAIDVIPTLLDLLHLTSDNIDDNLQENGPDLSIFDGLSLMRDCRDCRDMSASFCSPGRYCVIIRYLEYKLITMRDGDDYFVDLNVDPSEDQLIPIEQLNGHELDVAHRMKAYSNELQDNIKQKWGYSE
eukprot:NODE_771_length_4026_cov_0.732620.p1 type:complete len:660 gc:universal NODE_771_length_4026_cov_0.732620:1752-3731(+)